MLKLFALFKRDLLEYVSYKFTFVFDLVKVVFLVLFLFFIGRLFGGTKTFYLQEYNYNYFSFAIVGVAFSYYLTAGLFSLSSIIDTERLNGSFEPLLLSLGSPYTLIIYSLLLGFGVATINVFAYFFIAKFVFGLNILWGRIFFSLAVLGIFLILFYGLGVFIASFSLFFRQANSLFSYLDIALKFISGVFFPVSVFPVWFKKVNVLNPFVGFFNIQRDILIKGGSFTLLIPRLEKMFFLSILILAISIFCFKFSLEKAKKEGYLNLT